jgi:thiol:disulfide interchange protein DsbG
MISKREFVMSGLALSVFGLAACSGEATGNKTAPEVVVNTIEDLKQARGFQVGSNMMARPVYVFFDPQCPHCAALWSAAKPLRDKIRMTWAPVAILNRASMTQGAAILGAADPVAKMDEHESSFNPQAGRMGLAASSSVPDDIRAAIEKNTKLLEAAKGTSVPYLVAENGAGGLRTTAGGMPTAQLAAWLGITS